MPQTATTSWEVVWYRAGSYSIVIETMCVVIWMMCVVILTILRMSPQLIFDED